MNPTDMIKELHRQATLALTPAPMYVYKPRADGSGVALKLNLRLKVQMTAGEDGTEYVKDVDGGLFLEMVAQAGKTDDGKHAKFAWNDDDKKIMAKLGLNDQLSLLTAFREIRTRGKPLPDALRNKKEQDAGKAARTLSLFHKFGNSSTGILMTFEAATSSLRVSKSASLWKSINLTLMDEIQIESYLKIAFDAYLRLGLR